MQNKLAEIVIRAERRAGEMLRDGDKAKGGQPYQKKSTPCTMQGVETLADLGIEYTQSHRWQKAEGASEKTGCIVQPVSTLADLGIEKTQSHRWP